MNKITRKTIGWTLIGIPFLVFIAVLWVGVGFQAALCFIATLVMAAMLTGCVMAGITLLEP